MGSARFAVWMVAAAVLATGCGRSHKRERLGLIPPPIPQFFSGPISVLLTNSPGFAGHVVFESGSLANPGENVSGDLLGRDNKLLFAFDRSSPIGKRLRPGGFSFLWDVAEHRGYLLSEALQGYAPISSTLQVSNIIVQSSRPGERIDGHPCQRAKVEIQSNRGPAAFDVWQATDLHLFPLRITSAGDVRPLTFTLSNVRIEAPSSKQFAPPESFTRYDSAESMMAEMAMRQENLWRKPTEEPTELPPLPRPPTGVDRY